MSENNVGEIIQKLNSSLQNIASKIMLLRSGVLVIFADGSKVELNSTQKSKLRTQIITEIDDLTKKLSALRTKLTEL